MVSDGADIVPSRDRVPPGLWVIVAIGMSPFPGSAAVYGFGPPALAPMALTVILSWSAVVLAFLGGVRWGLETARPHPRWQRQALSVLSPVAAWGLMLARHSLSDTVIIGGCIAAFLVQWLYDHQAPDVPARYPLLSTATAGAACVSLAVCLDQAMRTSPILP